MNQENLKKLLFIDVQTTSSSASYADLTPAWQKLWDEQVFRDEEIVSLSPAERYVKKAALRAEFAKIITVSLGAILFPQGKEPLLHVRAVVGTEVDVLTRTASAFEKFSGLVAHGGKSFDYPTLARRYLANGLVVPKLIDSRGQKPWEITNVDTQELWRFGDSAWPSLNLLTKVLGVDVPQKYDAEKIPEMYWSTGEKELALKEIADYSAKEVVRTANVYVKLQEPSLSLIYQIA